MSKVPRLTQSKILIVLLSLLLVACLVQGEFLLMPRPLGFFGWIIYRLAFCIAMPPRLVAMLLFPENDDHFWPASHYVALALMMPFYLHLLRLAWRRFTVRYHLAPRIPMRNAECGMRNEELKIADCGLKIAGADARGPGRIKSRISNLKSQISDEDDNREEDFLVLSRRNFLLSAAAGSLGLATSGVGGYAALVEPEQLKIRDYTIPVRDLPDALAGLRIIHVSDTHYGPFVSMRTLEHAVRVVNRLEGDLVVLTGDYMHRTKRSLKPGIGVLGGIKGRLGVVGVLGNHDHWEGTRECYKAFDGINVPLLDNRHLYLTPDGLRQDGKYVKGRTLCLAGVGDLWEDEVSFRKALRGVPDKMPRVMLGHNPDVAEMIDPALRVDLLLAGHTHGGQVSLPLLGPPKVGEYGYKYLGGLCHGPVCPVVVSRGVGMSGLPLRLNVPPEVGVITLSQA